MLPAEVEIIGENQTVNENEDIWDAFNYFPSTVYKLKKLKFLNDAKVACNEAILKEKTRNKLNDIYPVYMSENLFGYKGMDKLVEYIGSTAWNILKSQGYAIDHYRTTLDAFWCQEHYMHSAMEQHVHGAGSQIVGFYFVQIPENSSEVLFFDPRSAKVQINLPEADLSAASPASNIIRFTPEEGTLLLTNSYIAHSFTRHASKTACQFIHFNVSVVPAPREPDTGCHLPPAEIV